MAGILQVHPTRWCNLRCHHCYSESGPEHRDALAPDVLLAAIREARELGYRVVSLSGGEPTLYAGLERVVASARSLGLSVQLVTNGYFLARPAVRRVLRRVDRVAVSVDGFAASHDRMRGAPGAWSRVGRALDVLAEEGVGHGLNVTVGPATLDELPEIAGFAAERGVDLLQLHPLHEAGRAGEQGVAGLDRDLASHCFSAAAILDDALGGAMEVQCDLVPRRRAVALSRSTARPAADDPGRLADALPVLVVDADGALRPLVYAMAPALSLGHLGARGLRDLADGYLRSPRGMPALARLLDDLAGRLEAPGAPAVLNWFHEVACLSRGLAPWRAPAPAGAQADSGKEEAWCASPVPSSSPRA